MTDHDLDEMLNQWNVPPMRDSLRDDLRAEFIAMPARPRREGRLRRMVAALPRVRMSRLALAPLAAAALLFILVQVSPRTVRMASPGFRIPFYVEFENTVYAKDGSLERRSWMTTFPWGGHGINMTVWQSLGPVLDRVREVAMSVRNQFVVAMPSLVLPKHPPMTEPAWFAGFVRSGCSEGRNVIGHETIAGYPTTIVEEGPPHYRLKIWMAPDLNCFALKLTQEAQQPDGAYRLVVRKEALKVTMNP